MFTYDITKDCTNFVEDMECIATVNGNRVFGLRLMSAVGYDSITSMLWVTPSGEYMYYPDCPQSANLMHNPGRKSTLDIILPPGRVPVSHGISGASINIVKDATGATSLEYKPTTPPTVSIGSPLGTAEMPGIWNSLMPDVLTFTPPSSGMATIEYKPTIKKEAKDVTSIPSSLALSAEKFAEEMDTMVDAMRALGSMGTSLSAKVPRTPAPATASTAGKWVMTPAAAKLAAKSAITKPTTKDKETIEMATPTTWELVEAVAGITPRMLLYGDPGTGKSYGAQRLGVKDKQKVYSITLTEETSMALLQGFYVPGVDDEGRERMIWKDGPATLAWREGARLVINEVANASGDVMTYLYAVLDDTESAMITLPNNETVRPAESFSVIATMNGNPDESLPEAIRDRFPVCLKIEQVHPEAIKRLPTDLQPLARDTALAKDVNRRVSIRSWLAFDHLRKEKGLEIAAHAVFGHRAKDIITSLKISAAK